MVKKQKKEKTLIEEEKTLEEEKILEEEKSVRDIIRVGTFDNAN